MEPMYDVWCTYGRDRHERQWEVDKGGGNIAGATPTGLIILDTGARGVEQPHVS